MTKPKNVQNLPKKISFLHDKLLHWYRKYKRDLPWRKTKDPYLIWVSEVMLQQTRVETVIDYYNRFTKKFPTLTELSKASEHEVLNQWKGLGYYRRAKLIHQAAKEVAEKYSGELPKTRESLSELPGFGPYTSGAVASIAFGEKVPAIDGNVKRVLSRIFATHEGIEKIAELAADVSHPSDWTQSLMELGAIICIPKNPKCLICPVNKGCEAFQANTVNEFPKIFKKTKSKILHATVSIIADPTQKKFLIQQRGSDGRYAGMWEFPTLESTEKQTEKNKLGSFTHILTHRTIHIDVVQGNFRKSFQLTKNQRWISFDEIPNYPFSKMQLRALEIWKKFAAKDLPEVKVRNRVR